MHTPLEAPTNRIIELPRDIRGAEDEDALGILAYAVHLHQHLCFDAAGGFGLAFVAGAAQGVDFVDEDDRGLVLAGHGEELLYQSGGG